MPLALPLAYSRNAAALAEPVAHSQQIYSPPKRLTLIENWPVIERIIWRE